MSIFSWMRRKLAQAPAPAPLIAPMRPSDPAPAHRSWVRTPAGIGWIRRHEPDGWYVEFEGSDEIIKFPFAYVENVPPPEATS